MDQDPVVIVGAARTPMGAFLGELKDMPSPQLGGVAIRAALERAKVAPDAVSEVLMGCVLPAGVGQAPARQASIAAGIPKGVPCTTVSKVCGSGMKAVMIGHDALLAGSSEIVVAGGQESMSNAPYLLPKERNGQRLGHGRVIDHMFFDGLEDAYDKGRLMGTFAEDTAAKYKVSREDQDNFARRSLERARTAIENGYFKDEIAPVSLGKKGEATTDEGPGKGNPEKIATLKPAFRENGTVTAANSSSISDGAAALVLMRRSQAQARGLKPIATIHAHASHAHEPAWFTTAPVEAINKVLKRAGWKKDDVDLFEINEAFAVVTLVAQRELGLDQDKVNVHGGACALGHPIGASGARILVTLLGALKTHGKKKGVAALCIGGGEATAVAVELN